MAPLQESVQAQVSRHPEAPALRPLRLALTLLPLPLPLQEQDLRRAYTEVAAAHRQQLCQLEFARKMLEKVRGGCPLRSPARRPGPAVFFYHLPLWGSTSPQFSLPSSSYRLVPISALGPGDVIQGGPSLATGQSPSADQRKSPPSLLQP